MIKRKGMNPALARMTQIRKDNMLISAAGKANMIISLMVLHDKFGYGEKRLNKFIDEYQKQLDAYNSGYVESVNDFTDVLKLEKTLMEIECSIKDHERRGNTHTQSVLEQAREIVGMCAESARSPSELKEILERKAYNDGWIPCEERMPEEAGTYIINALTGERNIVTFTKWQNRYKRFDMTGARTYWKIIAWRPLPDPYRPERSKG